MIRIEQLRKAWPGFTLEIEDLEIAPGEYFVVLGPTGAGKTVLLLCLAGILRPDSGRVWFDERNVTDLPPEHRTVGWVSQSNTLFPHLTVAQNVGFGRRYCRRDTGILPAKGWHGHPARENHGQDAHATSFDQRVARLSELLDLRRLLDRQPADLSGGEIQRVMLARALALEPRVLLLDEPLRGLDPATQERLCGELGRIHRELGTTTFHITHDHIEARALADRIAVLRDGRMEQIGAAEEVFERPTTCFVARFTGAENLFALSKSALSAGEGDIQFLDRRLLPQGIAADDTTHVAIRPEHIEIRPDNEAANAAPSESLRLKGKIASLAKQGGWLRVTVRCETTSWVALIHPRDAAQCCLELGSNVIIAVGSQHLIQIKESPSDTKNESLKSRNLVS